MSETKFNSQSKITIRSSWNKELLKFISENTDSQLVYLGLPSPEATDVLEWLEYIDQVIAFQCREYPKPSHPDQDRSEIDKLEQKLEELERKSLINTFVVYDGYMEEVLLKGKDNVGIEFFQNDLIHVYNLDFCNQLQYPMEITDNEGEIQKVYKFDVIKNLIKSQLKIQTDISKFVLFLTITNTFKGKDFDEYITQHPCPKRKEYFKEIMQSGIQNKEKRMRVLRSYVLEVLNKIFVEHDYVIDILPTIHYDGTSDFKLLHFTFFGTKAPGSTPKNKSIPKYLKKKFLTVNEDSFANYDLETLSEKDNKKLCPIKYFKKTKTFKSYW